jgi:stalled ribosome rescue protein Dom34
MKKTGIWIDKDKALIVTLENEYEGFQTITSNVDHFNVHGGSGTRQKGGPQNVVHDSKYLEREKSQLKQYFKNLAEIIEDSDALVLFGPAKTCEKFSESLHENHKILSTKIQGVRKADSMTDNQVKAWVRDFFRSK